MLFQRQGRGKSVRQPARVNNQLLKKKVIKYITIILVFSILYILFFSTIFQIKYLQIVGNDAINTNEIEEVIWQSLDENILFIFNRDNYWLLSIDKLVSDIEQKYTFDELTINKKYPDTLSLKIKEKIGRLFWQAGDKFYVIDINGTVTRHLTETHIIQKVNIPIVRDNSNSEVNIGEQLLSSELISAMVETYQLYNEYINNDALSFISFQVDDKDDALFKVITKSGIELHMNDQLPVGEQLEKLAKVLRSNKIDLDSITYINLRITEQVIYK